MRYIDSSAFVKYYSEENAEKGSDKIRIVIDEAKGGDEALISSVLIIGEVISTFDKWLRLKILTKEQLTETIKDFINDLRELAENGTIIFEEMNTLNMIFAVEYVMNYHLTVNDALHLYAALINKNEIREFISSDKMLNKAAEAEGLIVFDPEE